MPSDSLIPKKYKKKEKNQNHIFMGLYSPPGYVNFLVRIYYTADNFYFYNL